MDLPDDIIGVIRDFIEDPILYRVYRSLGRRFWKQCPISKPLDFTEVDMTTLPLYPHYLDLYIIIQLLEMKKLVGEMLQIWKPYVIK